MDYITRYRKSPKGRRTHAAYQRRWKAANAERARQIDRASYKRNQKLRCLRQRCYQRNVTIEWFVAQLAKQKNRCACCGHKLRPGRSTCIDHCHKTGKVRGIICSACNLILGFANDDIAHLSMAIRYLKIFK